MATIVLAFVLIALTILAVSVGVLFGRQPVKGSCGGLSCIKGADCAICPNRTHEEARP